MMSCGTDPNEIFIFELISEVSYFICRIILFSAIW